MTLNRRHFLQFFSVSLLGTLLLKAEITEASKLDVRNIAKKITVQLLYPGTSGSGVLLFQDEHTYYVLTAQHVVANTQVQEEAYAVTFDQQQHLIQNKATYVLSDLDAVLIQFQSKRNYTTATLGDSNRLTETDSLYVSGFPLPGEAIKTSTFTITTGELAGIGEAPRGYELIYDNVTQPGMSGGPVLNASGQLVGIHGLAEGERVQGIAVKAGLNLGIPIQSILPWIPLSLEVAPPSQPVASTAQLSNDNADFEQFIRQYYTNLAIFVQNRDSEGLFAFEQINTEEYQFKQLSGQTQNYSSRIVAITKKYNRSRKIGERFKDMRFNIDAIEYLSASQAVVTVTLLGRRSILFGLGGGLFQQRFKFRWDNSNGQWLNTKTEELPAQ